MRIAIFSDIHGNVDAFRKVLADIDAQQVDDVIGLGDNVGYGPDPNECVALLKERGITSVLGNHEHGLLRERHRVWFNPKPRIALEVTASLLSDETCDYIASLPRVVLRHGLRFVHGYPPDSPYYYLYAADDAKLRKTFSRMPEDVCFLGHTHLLELVTNAPSGPTRQDIGEGDHQLDAGVKYLVNVGSVGQPRDDFNRKAKYVIYDTEARIVTVRYVAYDARPVAEKMKAQGVPDQFADMLLG